eukprot:4893367-Amphidinium_carterae.2
MQHKRSDAFEQERQRKERRLEGHVKQEVNRIEQPTREQPTRAREPEGHVKQEINRIEKQTRASEVTMDEPPKQRPRVVPVPTQAPRFRQRDAVSDMETEAGVLQGLREAAQEGRGHIEAASGSQWLGEDVSTAERRDVSTAECREDTDAAGNHWFGLHREQSDPRELADFRSWFVQGVAQHGQRAERGPVVVSKLPPKWRALFEPGSRVKEGTSVLPSMTPLSEGEALQVERSKAERIMPMRWLDSWKQTDEPRAGNDALDLPRDWRRRVALWCKDSLIQTSVRWRLMPPPLS